ncbi:MAG: 3-deoxy-manno-octulosonate cytidylyltransferase [Planctomycetaceae bacterium]
MKTVGIIPARLQSTRLPRKLLLSETGRPLIEYVWRIATECSVLDDVIVATDSDEIARVVREFGGRAEMTGDHPSGTDRIAEVVRRCCDDAEIVVNLQGDEPELSPVVVSELHAALMSSDCEMATVATPITESSVVRDPGCVKVVVSDSGQAMYFSRSPIPFSRDVSIDEVLSGETASPWLLHIGLYAYRRDFLLRLTTMPPSSLELLERLEQLRALQSGARIAVAVTQHASSGIDTPQDYAAFVRRQALRSQ